MPISAKIDVKKIDKDLLYPGEKGLYLDVILIETPNNEHSDYMVKQSVSKEQRENGVEGAILGNAKKFGGSKSKNEGKAPAKGGKKKEVEEEDDSIPF